MIYLMCWRQGLKAGGGIVLHIDAEKAYLWCTEHFAMGAEITIEYAKERKKGRISGLKEIGDHYIVDVVLVGGEKAPEGTRRERL